METIEVQGHGVQTKLLVNGLDISDITTGYSLTHEAGKLPVLTLSFSGIDIVVSENGVVQFPERVQRFLEECKKKESAIPDYTEMTDSVD